MHTPLFLRNRIVNVSLLVLAVVVVSVVALKSHSAAPSLSSANNSESHKLADTAGNLSVQAVNSASLGAAGNSASDIQGQSNASVQASGNMQSQAAASPQTSDNVQQSVPQNDVQQPVDLVRPHSTTTGTSSSSSLKGTLSIRNTGSTNTAGWTLLINADGSGSLTYASTGAQSWNNPSSKTYGAGFFDVSSLQSLISQVGSMSNLQPSAAVMKSASFGTSEYASYQGSTSGDLEASYSAASNAKQDLRSALLSLVSAALSK